MLPFLKKKQLNNSVVIANQKPEGLEEDNMPNDGLAAAMADFSLALKMDNHSLMAKALQAAFSMMDEPKEDEPMDEIDNAANLIKMVKFMKTL